MTDSGLSASIHAANYITLGSDLLHMIEKSRIAYGTTWKSRRMSWIRTGEDVAL